MFRLTIDTDNDAFGHTTEQERAELGRTVRLVATVVEISGMREGTVTDYNGNTVGSWTLDAAPDAVRDAAPEMLEALRELVDTLALDRLEDGGEAVGSAYAEQFAQARAAIAKAEGRAEK